MSRGLGDVYKRQILDMDFKSTIIAVMLGVLLAGIIMMVLSVAGFGMFLK